MNRADRRGARAARGVDASGGTRRCAACIGGRGPAPRRSSSRIVALYSLVFHTNLLWWVAAPLDVTSAAGAGRCDCRVRRRRRRIGQGRRRAQERRASRPSTSTRPASARHLDPLVRATSTAFREAEVDARAGDRPGRPAGATSCSSNAPPNTYQNVTFVARDPAGARVDARSCSSARRTTCAARCWSGASWRRRFDVIPTPPPQSQFYDHVRGALLRADHGRGARIRRDRSPTGVEAGSKARAMCGICGELRFDDAPASDRHLVAMRDRLVHRGPDAAGVYVSPGRARRPRLPPAAHHRSVSERPTSRCRTRTASVQLVFNGEIYNFRELRAGLVARGHQFRSHSDTEVIVHLYEENGRRVHRRSRRHVRDRDLGRARRAADAGPRSRRQEAAVLLPRRAAAGVRVGDQGVLRRIPTLRIEVDPDAVPYVLHLRLRAAARRRSTSTCVQLEPGTVMTVDADGTHRVAALLADRVSRRQQDGPADRRRGRGGRRARARDARRRAAAGQRRAARRLPQRRRRLDDRRRRDEPADDRAGEDVQHRLRGRSRRTTRRRTRGWPPTRFKTDHTEFRVTPSAHRSDRHADLASRRPVRRFVRGADLHRVEADARAGDGRPDRRRRRRAVCRLSALLRRA